MSSNNYVMVSVFVETDELGEIRANHIFSDDEWEQIKSLSVEDADGEYPLSLYVGSIEILSVESFAELMETVVLDVQPINDREYDILMRLFGDNQLGSAFSLPYFST